jgi:hypothetical protein
MRIAHEVDFESDPIFMIGVNCGPPNLDFCAPGFYLPVEDQVCHHFDNPVILQGLPAYRRPFGAAELAVAMGKRAGSMKG